MDDQSHHDRGQDYDPKGRSRDLDIDHWDR